MLYDIVESKTDSKVLGFLLAAPERSFSVLEVSKRLSLPRLKTAHSLNKLSGQNFLFHVSKGGKKYYLLNFKHPLLGSLKQAAKKEGLKYHDELFSAIKKLGEIKAAFLSGVFTGYPNLPVDILLVGKVNLKKLAEFLKAAQKLMGQDINYSIMTVEEYLLRRDTFDKFIKDIFDYRHVVVHDQLTKKAAKGTGLSGILPRP